MIHKELGKNLQEIKDIKFQCKFVFSLYTIYRSSEDLVKGTIMMLGVLAKVVGAPVRSVELRQ